MDTYDIRIDESMASFFEQLFMALEHEDENFKYLIKVKINRVHRVGAYPIEIMIYGYLKDFASENQDVAEVQNELEKKMKDQKSYDDYVFQKEKYFMAF